MNIHHLVGVSEDFGFVFLDPGHLVDGGGDADGRDAAAVRRRELGENLPDGRALVSHQRMGLCSYWSIAGVCS